MFIKSPFLHHCRASLPNQTMVSIPLPGVRASPQRPADPAKLKVLRKMELN